MVCLCFIHSGLGLMDTGDLINMLCRKGSRLSGIMISCAFKNSEDYEYILHALLKQRHLRTILVLIVL